MFVYNDISYQHMGTSLSCDDCEICSIVIERKFQRNILCVLAYRPPQGNVSMFLDKARNYINELYKEHSMDLLLMGDMNIDYLDVRNSNTKKLLSFMNSLNLNQVIRSPTRYSMNKGSLLDLMLTNLKFIKSAEPYNLNLSDHWPTLLVYKKTRERNKMVQITCRSYTEENLTKFKDLLNGEDWNNIYEMSDPNIIWDTLFKKSLKLLNETCPLKSITVKKDRPLYITNVIIEMGHERDRLFKVAMNLNTENSWKMARRQRTVTNYAIKKAKSMYFKEKLKECKDDSRKFWRQIKELIPDEKSKDIEIITDKGNGADLKGKEAGNYINKYFCEISSKLVADLPTCTSSFNPPSEIITFNYVWQNDLTENQVLEQIKLLD